MPGATSTASSFTLASARHSFIPSLEGSLTTGHRLPVLPPPEKISWQADDKDNDRRGEVSELVGVVEGKEDGVANDSAGSQNKQSRRPGVSRNAVGNWLACTVAPNRKNGRCAQSI